MKLALPPSLGPFIAKHRPGVPKLLRTLRQQAMLQGSTHHRRRPLRTHRAGTLPTVFEGVHLFAHNIGGFPNATAKQIRGFHQRRADLSKARALKVSAGLCFDGLPALQRLRQQIHHPPQALQLRHGAGFCINKSVCRVKPAGRITHSCCRSPQDPSTPPDGRHNPRGRR